MLHLSESHLQSLEATARTASSYLDACDSAARFVALDPVYYRACGELLSTIFHLVDARQAFPSLVRQSAAARDMVDTVDITRQLHLSRLIYYPELQAFLQRIAR